MPTELLTGEHTVVNKQNLIKERGPDRASAYFNFSGFLATQATTDKSMPKEGIHDGLLDAIVDADLQ